MGRIIGGVVVGYLAMAGVVFALFTIAYFVMGTERAFKPGVFEPSTLWLTIMLVGSFVAAMVGGMVSLIVAKSKKGPQWLALLVIVLGLLFSIPSLMGKPKNEPRAAGITMSEAMQKAQTPAWVALSQTFLGAVGVLLGGKRRTSSEPQTPI